MSIDDAPSEEPRDSVAPEPEEVDPADAGGDSPGPPIGVPDELSASDRHGTTADEQREESLERRLEMERPDVWETGRAGEPQAAVKPIIDDDVPVEDLNVDEPHFDADEADIDRTPQEAGEESPERADEGPEGSAMHVEPE
jgi:hypothetical protein